MKNSSCLLLLLALMMPALAMGQSIQKLEDKFTSGSVSDAELRVFEERAVQKLKDFDDYLEIIANKTLDTKLRQDAIEQAENIFAGPDCNIHLPYRMLKVSDYLRMVYNQELKTLDIAAVTVGEPFTKKDGTYTGSLYTRKSNSGDTHYMTFKVKLIKVEKKFGDEVKEVWDVRLCD